MLNWAVVLSIYRFYHAFMKKLKEKYEKACFDNSHFGKHHQHHQFFVLEKQKRVRVNNVIDKNPKTQSPHQTIWLIFQSSRS